MPFIGTSTSNAFFNFLLKYIVQFVCVALFSSTSAFASNFVHDPFFRYFSCDFSIHLLVFHFLNFV